MMQISIRRLTLLTGLAISALIVGCAGPAPHYSPSIDNVELLKNSGLQTIKVGQVGVTQGMSGANSMSLRGNSMVSPVGAHYGDYLAAALGQELELAKLQNPQSNQEVSGVLAKKQY